jgi:hypothetical protein
MILASSGFASAAAVSPSVVHVDLMDPSTSTSINGMMIKTDMRNVKAGSAQDPAGDGIRVSASFARASPRSPIARPLAPAGCTR